MYLGSSQVKRLKRRWTIGGAISGCTSDGCVGRVKLVKRSEEYNDLKTLWMGHEPEPVKAQVDIMSVVDRHQVRAERSRGG
mmetsp:Transcript_10773/g.25211  ORF Transcript_10773/g.25211 Transcript_10773/m.25211 type:complete len:81 (-) Transcript_10773:928-1170(-)